MASSNAPSGAAGKKPIAVTGAGGYIAGFIVEGLLARGITVHGTVRDPAAEKNQFLLRLADKYPNAVLKLFPADLEIKGSFDAAVAGCDVVIHTAAVVKTHYEKDPNAEIIGPTVEGVRNVIEACKKARVRRIVFTSSSSTILCAEKFRAEENRGKPYTEDQWVTHVTPTYGTYNFSKMTSERVLEAEWDGEMISLLPSWVIGPLQHGNVKASSSQAVIHTILSKQFGKFLCPRMFIHWVDVRDVANAHIYAATSASMPNGRYNVAGPENVSSATLSATFNKIDGGLGLPTAMMPWGVMWTASWWDKRLTSHFLYEKAVPACPIDSSKIERVGFAFQHNKSLETTLKATLDSYRAFGVLKS